MPSRVRLHAAIATMVASMCLFPIDSGRITSIAYSIANLPPALSNLLIGQLLLRILGDRPALVGINFPDRTSARQV